jgi:predicted permease
MIATILVCLSALVISALGLAHLIYTLRGPKLLPRDAALLLESTYLAAVGFAMLAALFELGRRYWFSIPVRGIAFSLLCYTIAQVVARL